MIYSRDLFSARVLKFSNNMINSQKESEVGKSTTETTTTVAVQSKEELWFGEDIDEKTFEQVYGKKKTAKEIKEMKKEMVEQMDTVTGDQAKYVVIYYKHMS